jgi:hypothetical protein
MRAGTQHNRCVHGEKNNARQTQEENGYLWQLVLPCANSGGNSNKKKKRPVRCEHDGIRGFVSQGRRGDQQSELYKNDQIESGVDAQSLEHWDTLASKTPLAASAYCLTFFGKVSDNF